VLVDRLGNATTTSVFTVLPISGPSREFLQQRPLYTIDGVTYALDEQRRLRHAFDSLGDSVTYEYDAQNRLTEVHYRDAADWQLHGTMSDGGERQLRCDTPNGDRLLYRFAADGALSEALVNEIPVARATWNADRSAVTLQHVRIVEDEEIGRLTVTKTEKVVATERLTRQPDGKIIYQREGNSREPQTVTLTRSPQGVTLEVPGLGTLGLKKAGEFAFIAEGPSGQVRWDFDPQSGRLTKISRDNGDYVELLSGTELADGSTMLLESKRGAAVAQVSASADRVVVRDFLGRRTVYGYAHGRLASIDSPLGKTSYEYTEDGGRLAAIRFPDHSVQRFQWREGTGVTRLTTWREAAVP
jgi:YD repeat-containing protein